MHGSRGMHVEDRATVGVSPLLPLCESQGSNQSHQAHKASVFPHCEPPRQPKTTILILSYQQSASWGLRNRHETQGELGSENYHIVFRENNRERLPTLVIYFAGSPKHRHRTYFHRGVCQQRHSQWNSARWLKCVWINNLSANFTGIILKTRRHHGKIPRARMFNKKIYNSPWVSAVSEVCYPRFILVRRH